MRFLDLLGVAPELRNYRVYIHETGDGEAAVRWWAEAVDVPPNRFRPTSFKKHNPRTVRRNVGDRYRGCLAVSVRGSRDLYRYVEGLVAGMTGEAPGDSGVGLS